MSGIVNGFIIGMRVRVASSDTVFPLTLLVLISRMNTDTEDSARRLPTARNAKLT